MSRTLVVGLDSGGTSTRCVVATLDGRVVGRGLAGGANQRSSGGRPADTLGAALAAALSTVDPAAVRLGVFGGAGAGAAGRAVFDAAAAAAWERAGLTGDVVTVTDLEVGYAAGTAAPDGTFLVAGTGAAAVRFAAGLPVRRCDGYGWLLGDDGSAVWIGVRALRAALAALDGRGGPTSLVDGVCAQLAVEPPPAGAAPQRREAVAQALIAEAYAGTPAALGRLAPVVSAAADAGDAVARRITDDAAGRLLHALATVRPPAGAPVVFGGSVLLSAGPVARAVRAGVVERFGTEPVHATDGAGGAAAIAIARLRGGSVPVTVHMRLTGPRPAGADRPHEPSRE
jgi:N-acetylglucosamine kinase-like BadF-type ATPase